MEEHQNKPNITLLTEVDYKYIIIEIIRSSSMIILFIIANILIFGEELKKAHFNKTPLFIFSIIFVSKIVQKITNRTKTLNEIKKIKTTNQTFDIYDIQFISKSKELSTTDYVEFTIVGKFNNQWYAFDYQRIYNKQIINGEKLFENHQQRVIKTPINEYDDHHYILENDIVNALLTEGE